MFCFSFVREERLHEEWSGEDQHVRGNIMIISVSLVISLNLIIAVGEMCTVLLDTHRQSWHHNLREHGKIAICALFPS